jgi:hypothetical protein
MSNEEVNEEVTEQPEAETGSNGSVKPDSVPLPVLERERKKAQALEKKLADIEAKQEEARLKDLSETDKLREELEATKKQAEQAERNRIESEQKSLVRVAAQSAKFNNLEDALTFVKLDAFEGLDGDALTAAVNAEIDRIVSEKPYLIAKEEEANPQGFGNPVKGKGGEEQTTGDFVQNLLFGKK